MHESHLGADHFSVVWMLVVLDVVGSDRSIESVLGDAHAVEEVVGSSGDILNQLVPSGGQVLDSSLANNTLDLEEAEVSVDNFGTEKSEDLGQHVLVLFVAESLQLLDAVVEAVSLSINLGKILHDIGGLVHQDLIWGLTLLLEGL